MLREPLVHFLGAGLLLFLVFNWYGGASTGEDMIVVDDAALARAIISRDPRLDADAALARLQMLDADERSRLIETVVREEVLYREALALGLNENDSVAKRRLVAQLDYLNRGMAYDALALSDQDVADYYAEQKSRYRTPAQSTFTHVFLNSETRGAGAMAAATNELEWLNQTSLPFHESASRGDHFLYHRNYVNDSHAEIASHFGSAFADAVFELEPGPQWHGPIRSDHGLHLVLVAERQAERVPPLSDVLDRVTDELARERVQAAMDDFYEAARERYQIAIRDSDG